MGCGASQRAEEVHRSTQIRRSSGSRASGSSAFRLRLRSTGRSADRSTERGDRVPRGRHVLLVRPHALRENFNAFCFECGTFCNLDRALTSASAVCPECGGDFVQFLWRVQESNWISADDPAARDFAFDDQLEDSISVSLAETPVPKKPTKKSFLQSLQPLHLNQSEVDARSRSRHSGDCSDPKSNCSICRDPFTVGDELHELPCHHEFHASCIQLWLHGSNTCPICRLQLPEAAEDELESVLEDKEGDKEPDKERTLRLEPREELPVEDGTATGSLGDGSADVAWHLPGALGEVDGAAGTC